MANFLITGGAGFIGSHLVEEVLNRGHAVRVLDNFSTGRRENLAPFLSRIELLEASLTDPDECQRACAGIDYVLHQGAIPSVPRSVEDPLATLQANVTGTVNLLLAAVRRKCRRLVYAASSSAYGGASADRQRESQLPAPLSPYAAQKLSGEYFCQAFAQCYGLQTVCLRYFNVFGPRQDPHSTYSAVIPRFIHAVLRDQPPVIYGDGLQTRDFTYVLNNVEGNLLAAQSERVPARGEVYNLACGDEISLLELLRQINAILGKQLQPRFEDPRPGDVRHSRACIDQAREVLGFKPVVTFNAGLRRTIDWFRDTLDREL